MNGRWERKEGRTFFIANGTSLGHRLSLWKTSEGWWVYDDPRGGVAFEKSIALAGPIEDFEAAKMAYLLQASIMGAAI